jgi:hypothetical protein
VATVLVRPRLEQVGGRDHRHTGRDDVLDDGELARDELRRDARQPARHASDDRRRPQAHEHVPRLAEHDRVVAAHTVR